MNLHKHSMLDLPYINFDNNLRTIIFYNSLIIQYTVSFVLRSIILTPQLYHLFEQDTFSIIKI